MKWYSILDENSKYLKQFGSYYSTVYQQDSELLCVRIYNNIKIKRYLLITFCLQTTCEVTNAWN